MVIASVQIKIDIPWSGSLKDKRSIVKGLCQRLRRLFNISVIEFDYHDLPQTIGLALALVTGSSNQADRIIDHILNWLQDNVDGSVFVLERELL